MLSHEAQCDGIVAVGHDAVLFVMPNFVWKPQFEYSYSSFFNIIEAFIRLLSHERIHI